MSLGDNVISKPHIRYERRQPDHAKAEEDAHALLVGRVSMAWNKLHDAMFLIFLTFIGIDRYKQAHALWHTSSSDKGQRDLLMAAATGLKKRRLKSLDWLAKQVEKLGAERNALIHTYMLKSITEDGVKLVPDFVTGKKTHRLKVSAIIEGNTAERIIGDLFVLSQYARMIYVHLAFPEDAPSPWPNRPRLPKLEGAIQKRMSLHKRRRVQKQKAPPQS